MRKLLFLLTCIALCSCNNQSNMERALQQYIEDGLKTENAKFDPKYKLIDYTVDDTLTNKEILDSIERVLNEIFLLEDMNKENFAKACKIQSDKEVDHYTSLKLPYFTKEVDSLLANWDNITRYSFDANYLYNWFAWRNKEISESQEALNWDFDPDLEIDEGVINDLLIENKEYYDLADSISRLHPDSVYRYCLTHKYSMINMLSNKRITLTDKVELDHNYKVVSYENQNSLDDLIMQNLGK